MLKKFPIQEKKERSALTSPGINAGVSGRIFDETLGKVERVEKGQPIKIIRNTPNKTIFIIRGIYYEIDSSKLYCR